MDNYEISRQRAQRYFLGIDQENVLRKWCLHHDEACIYVDFLGRRYRICRKSGAVECLEECREANYTEALSIYDLLCHAGEEKWLSGRFAPVNSLRGSNAVGVTTDFYTDFALRADRDPEGFRKACLKCGGMEQKIGDIGFCFPVFEGLTVQLKFYHSDEDFPSSITLLWDENMLQFVYYETVFYIAGVLLRRLQEAME